MNSTDPSRLSGIAAELAAALESASFTADGIAAHLGPHATEALFRGEPGVVRHACADGSRRSGLIRFLLLREPVGVNTLAELFGPTLALSLIDAHVATLTPAGDAAIAFDVRPHVIAGAHRVVFSDLDAAMTQHVPGPDHVLGVGSASLSLLSATPLTPVDSVLDLGCGSGVQALAQSGCAQRVVATDVHPRALDLARATLSANGVGNVELREGSWFEPVRGERFDRIVANPPFVVGTGEIGHVYRDSGLDLDGASELVVSRAAEHLAPGGTAFLLASWVHSCDGTWQSRVASWLPPTGVSAWVIQRDAVDPGMYVSTWLRDESIDPRSRKGVEATMRWLDHFAAEGVRGIGFGWVFIRDIGDAPTEVTAEDLTHPFDDPLGPEVEEYFTRMDWLRGIGLDDVAGSRFVVRPGLAASEVSVADSRTGMGFERTVVRVSRTEGPRFSHDIDATLYSILAGLNPRGLTLGDVAGLWAASHGLDDAATEKLISQAAAAAVDLVRHGLILPADIAELAALS
ncbi:methyltransferase [Corynebacterium liangguodongii]|uniref:rRNA methyltransferase n=1 Tax=Corynebacterium liangguodongii TaxID=2079535 RepID=A0A2S0WER2_9CORY|nr:class I SAM-dependent methyltransferase [Corynebacterium liangguodongii]AWB84152.1 rRNA methyltransferase [Corynebacterium liangguodongii]PWC00163.1 methyltransferase domain-containing protein [Corynebacterium liangguodongii]